MFRRRILSMSGSLILTGIVAGCSTNSSLSSENSQIIIRASNFSDSLKRIRVVGESSEGSSLFEKQLALLGSGKETQVIATVEPQERTTDELANITVTVENGGTRIIEYNPDSQGNEDVDIRIYTNVISYNYD